MLVRLRAPFDTYTLLLLAVVVAATLVPAQGQGAALFTWLTRFAIALLIFACTFALFPMLGWVAQPLLVLWLGEPLYVGVLYLCVLPGTVQSAIAFTAMARGNVPAAVCSASASSLIGIGLTPLLLALLLDLDTGGPMASLPEAIDKIGLQLLLPFVAGHLLRPVIGAWVTRHRQWLGKVDQGSILLVVYTAFSASVVGGLWQTVPPASLVGLVLLCVVLLAAVLSLTTWLARWLGFDKPDEIAIVFCGSKKSMATGVLVFCGSKKSMATGVPMAQVLFAGGAIGPVLLPLMIFHQLQLMVCVAIAQHYGRRESADEGVEFG